MDSISIDSHWWLSGVSELPPHVTRSPTARGIRTAHARAEKLVSLTRSHCFRRVHGNGVQSDPGTPKVRREVSREVYVCGPGCGETGDEAVGLLLAGEMRCALLLFHCRKISTTTRTKLIITSRAVAKKGSRLISWHSFCRPKTHSSIWVLGCEHSLLLRQQRSLLFENCGNNVWPCRYNFNPKHFNTFLCWFQNWTLLIPKGAEA